MQPLPIHPACESTPRRTDDEVSRLRDGLLNDGQTDPILTWHGQVIDGRHRQNILIAEGRAPRYEARDDMTEAEVLSLIWSRLDVRSIKPGQRAAWWELNHPKAEDGKQERRGNRHTSSRAFVTDKSSSPLPAGITQTMIDHISSLRRNAPELHALVASGTKTPNAAYKEYRKAEKAKNTSANVTTREPVRKMMSAAGVNMTSGSEQTKACKHMREVMGVSDLRAIDTTDPATAAKVKLVASALAGKSPDEQYSEHRREVATLPESSKVKFERLVATEKRLLNEIFRAEVTAEAMKTAPGLREEMEQQRDRYIRENASIARIKAGVRPLISENDYRFLLGVLHPDRAPEDRREKFARAFDIVRKLDSYIEACKP